MPEPGLRHIRLMKKIRMKNFVLLLHLLASGCRSRNMKARDSLIIQGNTMAKSKIVINWYIQDFIGRSN